MQQCAGGLFLDVEPSDMNTKSRVALTGALIEAADELDKRKLYAEANILTRVAQRVAQSNDGYEDLKHKYMLGDDHSPMHDYDPMRDYNPMDDLGKDAPPRFNPYMSDYEDGAQWPDGMDWSDDPTGRGPKGGGPTDYSPSDYNPTGDSPMGGSPMGDSAEMGIPYPDEEDDEPLDARGHYAHRKPR